MNIKTAKFVISNTDVAHCPVTDLPEYAFIGRSNVGKSTLINMITGVKGLAKTSSTPGKTQLINHFLINDNWFLVDLPGYGYATLSKEKKAKIELTITNYILKRKNLLCVFVLADSRHTVQRIDSEFMEWLATKQVPFVIVFTKADKLTKTKLMKGIEDYRAEMMKSWEELPPMYITSAVKSLGRTEILDLIEETNKGFKK